jgi:hypothetical protein
VLADNVTLALWQLLSLLKLLLCLLLLVLLTPLLSLLLPVQLLQVLLLLHLLLLHSSQHLFKLPGDGAVGLLTAGARSLWW